MSQFLRLKQLADTHPAKLFLYLLFAVTGVRIIFLFFSQIDLGPDETQYWWWSRELAFGYFSKPPMIAWLIGSTTFVFGNAEWAVRLSSPFIIAATAWLIFVVARDLYNEKTALWSGIVWMTMPVISLANAIVSTDIPLLFFWALALLAFVKIADKASIVWAVILGAALGLGMLSKYAMIYFPFCMVLAFALSSYARKALRPTQLLIAAGVAALVFLPNILWNAANEFQTLAHTQENAQWNKDTFNFDEFFEFFGAQFGVAGPIIFGTLLWGLITLKKRIGDDESLGSRDLMLIGFALPPLVVILFQAFISHANANWAMASYPAVTILVVTWLIRAGSIKWVQVSTSVHVVVALVFMIATTNFSIVDALGMSNSIKRVRGWEQQAADIAAYAEQYPAIVVDDRELMGHLLYYMRTYGKPIYAWDLNRNVEHHYEAFDLFDPASVETALLVAKYPAYLYSYVEFDNILELGISAADMKVECRRQYSLYELSGYDSSKGPDDIILPAESVSQPNENCRPY